MGKHMSVESKHKKRQRQKQSKKLKCVRKLKFSSSSSSQSIAISEQSSEIEVPWPATKPCVFSPPSDSIPKPRPNEPLAPGTELGVLSPPATPCDDVVPDYEGSMSDELFGDMIYSKQKKEAEEIRQYQKRKELLKKCKYGSFVDDATGLTASNGSLCPISILNKLPILERVAVKKYIDELHTKEKKAVFIAQSFRDQYEHLRKKAIENATKAHAEKEGVRYFWRNQLLEGCSRSGKMVNMALMKRKSILKQ